MNKKGVILCGGKGTRLRPATLTTNKHLLAIVNEPMILFPLRTLVSMGVTDVLIITGGEHLGAFADFLGDGSDYGVTITYRVQKEAAGIAQALSLAEDFYAGYKDKVIAILGDNIYENDALDLKYTEGDEAFLFLSKVKNPRRFGVATLALFRLHPRMVSKVVEKPETPDPEGYAVTGLYIYPQSVFEVIKTLKPSARGELEITDVNNYYVEIGQCRGIIYEGFWSDAGTPESLLEVSNWAFSKRLT